MANQTVTTNANLDDASLSGLLNGETITINAGATLTVNSDSRWGQQAAVLGLTTINDGALVVDGTQVWWLPFDASTGNVPALGTAGVLDVSVGGSTIAEFLGVFTALAVSPSTAGTAMPTSGFVKLRRKTANFADNDVVTLPGGATITVNSATGGQRGWLNIVGRDASTGVAVSGFSSTTWTGDWFDLGTTNGSVGQQIKYYVADLCPALQIETAAGSGVYEWWQHIPATNAPAGTITTTAGSAIVTGTGTTFNTTNTPIGSPLFSGDTIIGFVLSIQSTTQLTLTAPALAVVTGAGSLRTSSGSFGIAAANFGTDARNNVYTSNPSTGTITFCGANAGRLPPSGAKIRAPNIHVSIAASSNYAQNIISAFPVYTMVITNSLNASTVMSHVNGQHRFAGGGRLFDIRFCGHIDGNGRTGAEGPSGSEEVYYQDCVTCQHVSYGGSYAAHFYIQNCKKVTLKNCYMWGMFSDFAFNVRLSSNVTFDGGFFMRPQSNTWCGSVVGCTNFLVQDTRIGNLGSNFYNWQIDGCTGVVLKNWTYVGRNNPATQNISSVQIGILNTTDVLWDGYQFWIDAPTGNCSWSNCSDVRIRNIGTPGAPFTAGVNFNLTGFAPVLRRFSASKIYIANNNASQLSISPSDSYLLNACYVTSGTGQFDTYTQVPGYARRGLGGTLRLGGVGGHFSEILNSLLAPTTIRLILACGSPIDATDYRSQIAFTDDVGTIRRDGASVALVALNDQITWTWTYMVKGVTSFANTAPTINGTNTGNLEITYDVDKGTGFTGTFKALTAANLSAETGISINGVRLRIRARCTTANVGNRLNSIYVFANTDTASINATPYPDNEAIVTITGSETGTRAAAFRDSDGALLYQAAKDAPIYLFCDWFTDTAATLRVRKPGRVTLESSFTLTELGTSIPVSQTANTIAGTNPGSRAITVTNHGASPVTWNSKQWSITVTVTDGSTPAQIAQWLAWQTAQDSYSLGSGLHNMAWPDMVVPSGTGFETARGRLFGSAGAALKGVRIVNGSGDEYPGFVRMQADDGTYYSPPVVQTQSVTVSNGVAGTLLLIQDVTNPASPINLYLGTPATWPHTWTDSSPYVADRDIRVRAAYQSGTSAKIFIDEVIGTSTNANAALSYRLNQVDDVVYATNAIDGSTVTDVVIDDDMLLVEVSTGSISWASIYAYEVYWLATTAGIVDEGRIINAVDVANYIFEGPWKIKNVSSPVVPLRIIGGFGRSQVDGTTETMVDTTGGYIFSNPPQVIAYAAGSTITPQDKTDIAAAVLTAAQAAPIHADIRKVNAITVDGAGTDADPFGPA